MATDTSVETHPHTSSREVRERPCLCPFWRTNNTFPVAAPWAKWQYVGTPTLVSGKEHGMQGRNLVTAGFRGQGWEGKALRWANHRVCPLMQITSSLAYSLPHPSLVSLLTPLHPLALERSHCQLGTASEDKWGHPTLTWNVLGFQVVQPLCYTV